MSEIFVISSDAKSLPSLAGRIAGELTKKANFCLWLEGPLGAGKTTLSGHILRALGLAADVRVLSPTYTYMNEYQIGGEWYAHLDLYRMTGHLSSEDLGLLDARPFRGILVEWPERMPGDPALTPSHILKVAFTQDDTTRAFTLSNSRARG